MENWAIMDDAGILFSGTEDQMRKQLDLITTGQCLLENPQGDIRLIEIHKTTRQYRRK